MSTSKTCLAVITVLVALLLAGCGPAAPASPPQAPPSIPTEPPATSQLAPTPAPSLPTPPLTLAEVPGATRVRDKDGSVMVYVPAGEFTMGSREDDPDALGDERPQHTVYLSAFWIDQTEVTNEQYGRCVAAGACQASPYADRGPFNDPDYPVVGVSWHDAKAYCQSLLPMGGKAAADGGAVGEGRARNGRADVSLGGYLWQQQAELLRCQL